MEHQVLFARSSQSRVELHEPPDCTQRHRRRHDNALDRHSWTDGTKRVASAEGPWQDMLKAVYKGGRGRLDLLFHPFPRPRHYTSGGAPEAVSAAASSPARPGCATLLRFFTPSRPDCGSDRPKHVRQRAPDGQTADAGAKGSGSTNSRRRCLWEIRRRGYQSRRG